MKNRKGNIILILLLSVIVLILAFKDNFGEKIHYLFTLNPIWVILSFLLIISYWVLKGLVLYYCTSQINKKYTKKNGIYLMITTQFFHAITPFASGGQPWQVYKLKKQGLSLGESTNIVIEDFIAYQIALVFLGMIAVVSNHIFNIVPYNSALGYLVTLGFVLNTSVIVILFIVAFSTKWNRIIIKGTINLLSKIRIIKDKNELLKKSEDFISNFHESAIILFKNKVNLFRIIAMNFIALILQYLIPFTLMLGLNIYVNPFYVLVTSAYVMLIDSIVPTPGSTGGLEYGFMSFFKTFISDSKLSIIMIVWRIVTYYFGILVGLLFLNFHKEEK